MWTMVSRDQGALLGMTAEEFTRQGAAQVPLWRMEKPEDVAPVVAFLAGPRSGYMTGQALSVDGGLVMHEARARRGDRVLTTVGGAPAIRWQRHPASTGGLRSSRHGRPSLFLLVQQPADRGAQPTACEIEWPESESDGDIGAVSYPGL